GGTLRESQEAAGGAGGPRRAVTAVPADADAGAGLPCRDALADRVDAPRDLVPGDARQREARELAGPHDRVAVAHAARLDLDAHLARSGLRHFAVDQFERSTRLADLDSLHLRHGVLRCSCSRWLAPTSSPAA